MPRHPSLTRHIRTIRRSTRILASSFARIERQMRRLERQAKRAAAPAKRKLRITPKRRAQLKLQGAYMGFMRQLKPRQKARVRAVKERRGHEAAIKLARKFAR